MTETKNIDLRGTRVNTPDLDWSQIRETVLLIELGAGQIEAAMKDSNASVDVLTNSFTTMATAMQSISATIAAMPDTPGDAKDELAAMTSQVSGMVNHAIIAFQFYDKLVQRLAHVNHGLAGLSALVSDNVRLYNPGEWRALQQAIRSKYSMVEEQAMFDAVMSGMPVKDALEHFMAQMNKSDDVELF
jgi:prophage DNA circulation protein